MAIAETTAPRSARDTRRARGQRAGLPHPVIDGRFCRRACFSSEAVPCEDGDDMPILCGRLIDPD